MTVSVFPDLGKFYLWALLVVALPFSQFLYPFHLVRLFQDWVFLVDGSGANTNQLSISHGGQQFMVSPAENGSGLNLTVYPTIGKSCRVQGKIPIPF